MKKLICIFQIMVAISVNGAVFATDQQQVAKDLGWKNTSTCTKEGTMCGGYYTEPQAIKNVPNPPPFKTVPVNITAKGPVIFRPNGTSLLQNDVVITQPGRRMHADTAIIYHDKKTGKIKDIQLIGHVSVQEAGKLMVGKKADYNVEKNTLTVNNAVFHIAGQHQLLTITTPFDALGTAEKMHRDANGIITLQNASYSTCSPSDPSWVMTAQSMRLDHTSGEGTAKNIVIRFKKVPIFYTPYYSFPLNAERKSGLLPPSIGYSSSQGFTLAEPYYWNIAPNYDLLFTPTWYSQRGAQLNGLFRYLTNSSDGFLYTSFLPSDSQFKQFQQNTLNTYAGTTPSTTLQPYLSQLRDSSNQRAFLDFETHMEFTEQWSAKIYARYLTDPYFTEDFQSEYLTKNMNQIPSFAELNYQGDHWNDKFLIQGYQT
ncbi:MAG TPA: LPS assembly protein LptD, partial [Coxiellaceae bacterium]|nr:LPS assembly protein LptD [Coxiellaceae bacterium]